TTGLILKNKGTGKVVETVFHSTSGGRTANSGDVWTYAHPHLQSVEDKYEHTTAPAWLQNWNYTFSSSTILSQFGVDKNAELYGFIAHPRGANGEIGSVTIQTSAGDVTKSGNENVIRRLFPTGDQQYYGYLLSNWFTATVNQQIKNLFVQQTAGPVKLAVVKGQKVQTASGTVTLSSDNAKVQTSSGLVSTQAVESVTLNGKGWGHRIGMSQYGAYAYSKQGWKAEQILTHYFSNTSVSK
ncbi:SpoIID/LytB domain-containing protein, partial [Aeromonas veronii]|nr:SpoIID/LytB domain-containing protein [Aeromonas veronii]